MLILTSTIFGLIVIGATLGAVPYLILVERKVSAYIQDRVGPNRVGPHGIFQPVADGIKIFFKENFVPAEANRLLFFLGPALTMLGAMAVMAVIPFGGIWMLRGYHIPIQIAPGLDVGVVYAVLIGIGSIYGIIIGGWASNNKYSFYGAFRAVALILSYEIPLGVCVLCVFVLVQDLRLEVAVRQQMLNGWIFFYQPAVFIVMFIATLGELSRLPFDVAEAEQELVAGYHTEYSSMEFGLFFLGEYAHMIATSALLVTIFFGGWHLPYLTPHMEGGFWQTILKLTIMVAKMAVLIFIYMWVRWTLPRYRFDQIINVGWNWLLPMSLALLLLTGIFVYFGIAWTFWMTLANIAVLVAVFLWSIVKEGKSQWKRRTLSASPRLS